MAKKKKGIKSMKVSLSLMCMNLSLVSEQIKKLNSFTDNYHIDIMDGHYVKNLALSVDFIKTIRPLTNKPIDAHLMVDNPECYLDDLISAGTDLINIHAETLKGQAFRLINLIKNSNRRVGVVINPEESTTDIAPYLELVDVVTVMTVDPGYSGGKFIKQAVQNITQLQKLRIQNNLNYEIQVDGSCNPTTYQTLKEAGTDMLVLGNSGFFGFSSDLDECIRKTKEYFC